MDEMIFFNNFSKKYGENNHIFWGSFDKINYIYRAE